MIRVISDRTRAYVRKRVLEAMTANVTIYRMVKPALDTNTLFVTATSAETIYTGAARIRQVTGGAPIIVGEEQLSVAGTAISIPFDAALPRADDIVVVSSFGPDEELETRAFLVRDVDAGGLIRAARTMTCAIYEESRWWES